jgi:hypothetical protein
LTVVWSCYAAKNGVQTDGPGPQSPEEGAIIKITSNKRARAKAQVDRRKLKEQKRAEAKERKANAPARTDDEDPDIAGIVAGPQPLPDWLTDDEEEEEKE